MCAVVGEYAASTFSRNRWLRSWRHMGGVDPAMDERNQRQQIFGIILNDRPMDARLVGGCIAEHPKGAADQIGEPPLLTPLTFRGQRINREHRRVARERPVDQRIPIIGQARPRPELVGDAFHRFEDGVEIIVGH